MGHPMAPPPARSGLGFRLVAAVIVTLVVWGSAFAGIRAALVGYTPTHVALFRYTVASLTLAGYALAVRMPLPRWRDLPGLAAVGFIGITFYNTALNYGETVVPAATASFLIASAPVWMALLGAAFLREKLLLAGWAGIILSFAGVGVIAFGRAGLGQAGGLSLTGQLNWPALLVLAASVASAIYSLGQKPYLKRYSAVQTAAYIVWTGTVFLVPFGAGLPAEIMRAPLAATVACVYIGVVPGAIGYVTWAYVLSKTSASRAGSFLYGIPVVALAIAWVWLGEVRSPVSLLGGLLVLAGVVIVNARRSASRSSPPSPSGPASPRPSLLTRTVLPLEVGLDLGLVQPDRLHHHPGEERGLVSVVRRSRVQGRAPVLVDALGAHAPVLVPGHEHHVGVTLRSAQAPVLFRCAVDGPQRVGPAREREVHRPRAATG